MFERERTTRGLPAPEPEVAAASETLRARIVARIEEAGGWVPFADYMRWALYEPDLGYYSGGATKFGPAGDFITAPEITPLFGATLAEAIAPVLRQTGGIVLEAGAGTGLLAADVLRRLAELGALPERYAILEVSGSLRARQQETIAAQAGALAERVVWLEAVPDSFHGVLLANEVLDVLPVHLVGTAAGEVFERGVTVRDGALAWEDRPPTPAALAGLEGIELPRLEGQEYVTEVHPVARAWVGTLARALQAGMLLLIDYGYPRETYYVPWRWRGTLQCYFRHRVVEDPLWLPGAMDITSFVDFTSVAEAAEAEGLETLAFMNQAGFLLANGILQRLEERAEPGSLAYLKAARALQRLIMPHEMGELFKVIALGRGIEPPPWE